MLSLHDLTVRLGGVDILHSVSLALEPGEIFCLLGPSGCGKTTLLRAAAGLEMPSAGDIRWDGRSLTGIPPEGRGFGLMFQDFALFPHLTVGENVAFGLRMARVPRAERADRVREMLALVALAGAEGRDVASLSGGERQRVALARSLAPRPRLLMLDEPLGALDAALRDQLLADLTEIIRRVGLTALYVTHDQREALAAADRIGLMRAGRLVQVAAPAALYRRPASVFAARFLGLENIVPLVDGLALGRIPLPDAGGAAHALLHPDGLLLATPDDAQAILLRVTSAIYQGDHTRVQGETADGHRLTFRLPAAQPAPVVGAALALRVLPDYAMPLRE